MLRLTTACVLSAVVPVPLAAARPARSAGAPRLALAACPTWPPELRCACCAPADSGATESGSSGRARALLLSGGGGGGEPSEAAVRALKWYKQIISPLLPPGCRFIPTCSEYAAARASLRSLPIISRYSRRPSLELRYGAQCFEQFSVPQAIILTAWRLIRCNPLHLPNTGFGIDEPCWPPCAYWAGSGQVRTFVDDERSRRRAQGEDVDTPLPYDPLELNAPVEDD